MNHQQAIKRVREIREITGMVYLLQLAVDREAIDKLLAAIGHMPVGGDGEPLWAGKMVWTCFDRCLLCWTVIAVEPHGVRLSGSAASNELCKFSEVFSSREAVKEGETG